MIALNNGHVAVSDPLRSRRTPRRAADQAPRTPPAKVAKSRDAGKAKVSFYLDAEVAKKLVVAATIRGGDQSDVVNEILTRALSSVVFYDRAQTPTRTTGEPLTVTEIGEDASTD